MIGVKKNVVVFFGLFLVGMLFVPTVVESAWADWTFEGFLGEPYYCPGSDWPDNCWFNAPQDVAIDNSDRWSMSVFGNCNSKLDQEQRRLVGIKPN